MVGRRSGQGFESSRDSSSAYRDHARPSGEGARYSSRHHGISSASDHDLSVDKYARNSRRYSSSSFSQRSRKIERTRPSTRRPYRDTFYEDMLTDGIFDTPLDEEEFDAQVYYDSDDNPGLYDDLDEFDDFEKPRLAGREKTGVAAYSRDRYGSHVSRRSSEGVQEGTHSHASRYSSLHAADRYRKPSVKKRNSFNKKRIIIAALALVVVLVGGGLFLFINGISSNLQRGVNDDLRNALVQTDMTKEPFYMLLLGTDGSLERDATGDFGGTYRSDSIMLVRIDAIEKKVALVSISRDILVDLGEYGEQKLNAAYGLGGPALTVKAVSQLTGVDISHYAQVDFDGFSELVDALGGVTVNVPVDINDSDAGGKVSAGEQVLNGEKALILCRSRNTYSDTAAQPDAMRAANQRLVMSAIAHKLLDADIATIANSVQSLSNFVTTDLGVTDIIGLAQAMKGLDSTADIYTAMAPTKSQYIKDVSVDVIDREAWDKMMQRIKEGLPPTEEAQIDEYTGTVIATVGTEADITSGSKYATITVKNGTDREGLANQTRNVLLSYGFKNVVIGDVNSAYDYPETLVIYDKDTSEYGAEQIAKLIGQGKVIHNNGQYLMPDSDFLIVIGEDWV